MRHYSKISATKALISRASRVVGESFPAWIDASESGVVAACVMPRVRDGLVLRLVAGRRQSRGRTLLHAPGST